MIDVFLTSFVPAFATLLVVIDPLGCAPVFASLTADVSSEHRRSMARKSVLVAAAILLVFAFIGQPLLRILGISLDAFRVAGGIMLFMIALDMVFEKRTERRQTRAAQVARQAEEQHHSLEQEDISVFPMAMPMIAGPGSIGSLMLLMAKNTAGSLGMVAVLSALALTLLCTFATLSSASALLRLMGKTLTAVVTRLLGVLLAALAAQFVFDGVRHAWAG